MLGQAQNQLLQAVEQAVLEKVPKEQMNAFRRIVTAGEKVMYSQETRQMLEEQMSQQGDPAEVAGEGIAKLVALLFKESRGTMPMDAGMFAAQALLCEGLDFLEKSGRIQVTNELIGAATKAMFAYLLQLFGVSKDKLAEMMQQGAQSQSKPTATEDPAPASGIVQSARGGA